MTKIEIKLFDVLVSEPPGPLDVMLVFNAPSAAAPERPRFTIKGTTLMLLRRPGEGIVFRIKPRVAGLIAAVGSLLFAENGPERDYRLAPERIEGVPPTPLRRPPFTTLSPGHG